MDERPNNAYCSSAQGNVRFWHRQNSVSAGIVNVLYCSAGVAMNICANLTPFISDCSTGTIFIDFVLIISKAKLRSNHPINHPISTFSTYVVGSQ